MIDYQEFLKIPEIKTAYNDMFEERKNHFRNTSLISNGFDKEYLEAASIKMSLIATDLYFTEIHRNKYNNK